MHEHDKPERKTITVTVNGEPVAFTEHKATGLQIKEAAINQGVKIKADFNLFHIPHDGEPKPIGNDREVELKEGELFRAVTPDDKS
jgi:Multiubiquitin